MSPAATSADVTSADIDLLRTHRSESGFRGVYVSGRDAYGNTRYCGKFKRGGVLTCLPNSRSTDPRETAAAMVRWYIATYGSDWKQVLLGRKRKSWRCWYNSKLGGWLARCWLKGRPVELVSARSRNSVAVFSTHDDAVNALAAFVRGRTGRGLFRNPKLYRLGPAPTEPHPPEVGDLVTLLQLSSVTGIPVDRLRLVARRDEGLGRVVFGKRRFDAREAAILVAACQQPPAAGQVTRPGARLAACATGGC